MANAKRRIEQLENRQAAASRAAMPRHILLYSPPHNGYPARAGFMDGPGGFEQQPGETFEAFMERVKATGAEHQVHLPEKKPLP